MGSPSAARQLAMPRSLGLTRCGARCSSPYSGSKSTIQARSSTPRPASSLAGRQPCAVFQSTASSRARKLLWAPSSSRRRAPGPLGILRGLAELWREGKCYRGVSAMLLRAIPVHAVYMPTYSLTLAFVSRSHQPRRGHEQQPDSLRTEGQRPFASAATTFQYT